MKKRFLIPISFLLLLFIFLISYAINHSSGVLNPQGLIALKERNLIITEVLIMLVIIIPVFVATFLIAIKYRASNTKAKYTPDWTGNKLLQISWWAIPSLGIFFLAIIMWRATHELDPYKPIINGTTPLTIEVVALRWKWLFIYPQQNIATVNFIQFPVDTPLNFELTADAPMNSFWIPQLGGQMYAMAGMGTQLHLIADSPGDFAGSGAEISGQGFSGMKFVAKASSMADFKTWVQSVKASPNSLNLTQYNQLAQPSENNPVSFYGSTENNLYNEVMMKFTMPAGGNMENMEMKGMNQ